MKRATIALLALMLAACSYRETDPEIDAADEERCLELGYLKGSPAVQYCKENFQLLRAIEKVKQYR